VVRQFAIFNLQYVYFKGQAFTPDQVMENFKLKIDGLRANPASGLVCRIYRLSRAVILGFTSPLPVEWRQILPDRLNVTKREADLKERRIVGRQRAGRLCLGGQMRKVGDQCGVAGPGDRPYN
jgi:hypothetical protein